MNYRAIDTEAIEAILSEAKSRRVAHAEKFVEESFPGVIEEKKFAHTRTGVQFHVIYNGRLMRVTVEDKTPRGR